MIYVVYVLALLWIISDLSQSIKIFRTQSHTFQKRTHLYKRPVDVLVIGSATLAVAWAKMLSSIIGIVIILLSIRIDNHNALGFVMIFLMIESLIQAMGSSITVYFDNQTSQ